MQHQTLPKHVEPLLVMLRGPAPVPFGDEELDRLASQLKDHNYRLFAEGGKIRLLSAGLHLADADPFTVFEQLIERGPRILDPAHAFYLGYEAAKAVTALTLNKEYRQDEVLDWGFLTRPETSHRQTRIASPADAQASQEMPPAAPPNFGCQTPPDMSSPHMTKQPGAIGHAEELAESVAAFEELIPAPDPEDVFLRLAGLPHCVFFDSARRDPVLGRYSFIAADPFDYFELPVTDRRILAVGESADDGLAELHRRLAPFQAETIAGLPPFQGARLGC